MREKLTKIHEKKIPTLLFFFFFFIQYHTYNVNMYMIIQHSDLQSNKVQTCFTRYANIYLFFLERKEKHNRVIVMKNDELYKVGRKHTGLVFFVLYSQ